MLILTSNGLSSPALLEKTKGFCAKCSTAALVTTASVGFKDNDWHIPRLKTELSAIGIQTVDFFDFDTQPAAQLLRYDVVEIIGGNPFYLLRAMKNAQCADVLQQLRRDKILIGISAGTAVLQKSIALIAQYSPEMNDGIHLTDLSGFSLTNMEILPHYRRFVARFDRFEERAQDYERKNLCSVLRLDDGEAYFEN